MKFRTTFLIAVCAITALSVNAKGGIHDLPERYGIEKRSIFIDLESEANQDGYRHNSDWVWYVNSLGELRANPNQPYLNTGKSRPEEKFDVVNAFEMPESFPGDGCVTYVSYPYGSQPTPTDNRGYQANDGLSHARGYILEADSWGGDMVLTTNSDGWYPGQRAWSGSFFGWACLKIRAWSDYGEDVEITPVIELLGIAENGQDGHPQYWTVPSGTPLTPNGKNAGFGFDPIHTDGDVHTLWATADSLSGYPTYAMRITLKGSGQDGVKVEIYGMGLYSWFMDNTTTTHGNINREYRIGSNYVLPWFEYDMGGRDEAYHSDEFISASNHVYNHNKPYRLDQDSINAVGIDGGVTIGDFKFKGSTNYTSQIFSAWQKLTDMGWAEKEVVTKKEAQDFFGTWYDYTFSVPEDCEADINIATFANYGDARIIEPGWGSNGPRQKIEGIGSVVWPKRYAQAYVLELDGKPLKTNQTSYPEMIKDDDVLLGGHNTGDQFREAAYTADEFFNDVLPDKTKWRSTLLPDGTPSDTLYTWSYQNLGNAYTPGIPKYSTDASLGNQYQNVRLPAGTHTLRVNKLARLNNGFRGLTFEIHAKTSEWDDVMPGDVNGDGEVNVSDVVALANFAMGEIPEGFIKEAADLNNDGEVNIGDVVQLANNVMGS